jgi:hypothetical protein
LTASWYSNPGVWSYGLAALAFTWLAVRLIAQWQPGGKPAMLLAMAAASSAAAMAAVAFSVQPSAAAWWSVWAFDLLRSAATFGFLLAFLGVRAKSQGAHRGGRGWAVLAAIGLVLLLSQVLFGVRAPGVLDLEQTGQKLSFASQLAIAVFGLVLVEQCYRRTPSGSRWPVRPLLLGIGGILAFDMVLYSDALLFRVLDPELWSARGLAQTVTVPLMLLTLQRTRDWSFELSVSRGVIAGSTVLIAAGAYLVLIASAGWLLTGISCPLPPRFRYSSGALAGSLKSAMSSRGRRGTTA